MNLSTSIRLLAGATVVLACAVVPFWLTRPSRIGRVRPIVILPQAAANPYETEDPAAYWLLSRRYGSLLRYDGDDLVAGLADAWEREVFFTIPVPKGKSQAELIEKLTFAAASFPDWEFSCRPLPPMHVQIRVSDLAEDDPDLRKVVKEACGIALDPGRGESVRRLRVEARYVFQVRTGSKLPNGVPVPFRDRSAAQTVAADENLFQAFARLPGFLAPVEVVDATHVRFRTRRPSPDFERQIRELCPGVFGEWSVEQLLTLRTRRRGGDPAPAIDLRNTLESLRRYRHGRYAALAEAEIVRADSREIVLRSSKIEYALLEACTVPLAGREGGLQVTPGVWIRSSDCSGEVVDGLRSGRYAAAFLVDPPEDLPTAGTRLDVILGALLNARLPLPRRRELAEALRGKPSRLPGTPVRILCRQGEPAARELGVSLWGRLRAAGAQAAVEMAKAREFELRVARRDFDLIVDAFPASIESEPYRWWRTSGPANLSGLADSELDSLLATRDRTFEEEDRFRLRERIQDRLEELAVWIAFRRCGLRLVGRPNALELLGVPDR